MKKLILMVILATGIFAQTSPQVPTIPINIPTSLQGFTFFTGAALATRTPTTGMYAIGVAQSMNSKQDIFAEISVNPNASTVSRDKMFIAGFKTNFPVSNLKITSFGKTRIMTIRPFFVVGYGSTLTQAVTIFKAGGITNIQNPSAVITALSLTNNFTQNYGVGFTIIRKNGVSISFVGKVNKTTNDQTYAYPQVILSRTF